MNSPTIYLWYDSNPVAIVLDQMTASSFTQKKYPMAAQVSMS